MVSPSSDANTGSAMLSASTAARSAAVRWRSRWLLVFILHLLFFVVVQFLRDVARDDGQLDIAVHDGVHRTGHRAVDLALHDAVDPHTAIAAAAGHQLRHGKGQDYEGMIREGEELAALNPHIVVKVPCIADGIKAIKHFTEKGIRTNCTLVFSVGQALLAAKAGATYVSPFVGRLDDICEDGVGLVGDIVRMYRTYDYKTQVLAASIRNTKHIIECVEVGADVATCPLSAIKGLLNHPLTDSGLKKFLEDYKKVNG